MSYVVIMRRRRRLCKPKHKRKRLLEQKASVNKLKRLIRRYNNRRFTIRAYIIIFAKKGKSVREIASLLCISETTVRTWIRRFNEEHYKGLLDRPRSGRPGRLSSKALHVLVNTGPRAFGMDIEFWTVKTLHYVLEKRFNVHYSIKYVYELLKRHGYTLKKPRPRHYKADIASAVKVKQKIRELVEGGYRVLYEDETKVQLTTRIRKVVARRGQPAVMRVNNDYRGIFVFGAIDVRTKTVFVMLSERINSEATMKFLYKLKLKYGHGRIYVVWDNNGNHIAKRVRYLAKKKGIHFVQLTPYMPELNPMEVIWKQLKEYLANRLFFDVDELKREVMNFFASHGYKFKIKIESYFSE